MNIRPLAITVLDVDTFSLVCTATVPRSVTAPKEFVWRKGPSGNGTILTTGAGTAITSINVDDATSSSVLTVNATTQGSFSYSCDVTVQSSQSSTTATVAVNGIPI